MKRIIKFLFLTFSIFSSGCFANNSSSTKRQISSSAYSVFDYKDVEDKIILFGNMFGVDSNSYYVYFFSRTCSHCNELKSFILQKILSRDNIYLIEASEQIPFLDDVSKTIGLNSIERFGILGYPTLVKIEEKVITKNMAGIPAIRSELLN